MSATWNHLAGINQVCHPPWCCTRPQPPPLDYLLIGTTIAFKFDPPHGWALGEVTSHTPNAKRHNINVKYADGTCGHRLTQETYCGDPQDSAVSGTWVALSPANICGWCVPLLLCIRVYWVRCVLVCFNPGRVDIDYWLRYIINNWLHWIVLDG